MKINLFLDFDDTIVNSTKAFCDVYNDLYSYHPDYVFADWTKNTTWGFKETCTLMNDEEKKNLFRDIRFWDKLELMPDALNVITELKEQYNPIIVSLGTLGNLALKARFLKNNLPIVDNVILMKNSGTKMDKSLINMDGGIFIDDVLSNLTSTNSFEKFIFGAEKEYNIGSDLPRVSDWMNVRRELLGY